MKKPRAVSNPRTDRDYKSAPKRGTKLNTASTENPPETCQPQSKAGRSFDDRLGGLLVDSLASVDTAILSATEKVPYATLRQVMAVGEEEKRELTNAAQAVIAKHAAFFAKHKNALELALILTALGAAKVDHLLSVMDQCEGPTAAAQAGASVGHVCSPREALGIALIVLAPLGILGLAWLVQHLRRK